MDILLAVGDNATVVPLPIKADTPPRITSEFLSGELLQALPVAVYATDAAGRITFYNEAAATLWGCRPELGESEWCGSWRLYWPDGRPMPHNECPMAVALKEKRPISGAEAVAERPDGTRIRFLAYPTPLWDKADALAGAVNTLVDITDRREADDAARQLVAIVESSDDAIVSKDLEGTIVTWNPGAECLFGYTAEEVVGRSITILIPPDRHDEETEILNRIRRGERIDHYETVRRRKDGSLVEISLTVSPIKDADGRVTGASKIARDVTERRRAENQQRLLIREMNHRIGNLFALASAVTTLSARFAATPKDLADAVQERLVALSRAHNLTIANFGDEAKPEAATTLLNLIETITAPYAIRDRSTVILNGPDVPIRGKSAMSMALLLHEMATNAAKYGALSCSSGHVQVTWSVQQEELFLTWRERGGPPVNGQPKHDGFGSFLARMTARGQLGGNISYDWTQEGLTLNLSVPLDRLSK